MTRTLAKIPDDEDLRADRAAKEVYPYPEGINEVNLPRSKPERVSQELR
jgi:hypothetical protein